MPRHSFTAFGEQSCSLPRGKGLASLVARLTLVGPVHPSLRHEPVESR